MTEPIYLDAAQTTLAAIRARMLTAFLSAAPGMDVSEGSFPWDTLSPAALELAHVALALDQVLDRGFAQTTFGLYLEQRAGEHGLTRLPATPAKGTLRFTGTLGATVDAGTVVSTAGTTTVPAQSFTTDAAATITSGTTVDVPATAQQAGTAGNVGANTVTLLGSPIANITSVTNPAAMTGGTDSETDAALLARFLAHVADPSAGGNRADYLAWARAVAGVGGANVAFPTEGTPAVEAGNVRLSLIGVDNAPASLAVQDAVLTAIVDPRRLGPYEAEAFTLSGFGMTVDATQVDDSADSVKAVYNASGDGRATRAALHTLLAAQNGIWTIRARVKVDSVAGSTPFFRFGAWNLSTGDWAKASPSAADGTGVLTLAADDLATTFPDATYDLLWPAVDAYIDGVSTYELRLERLVADTTTQLWIDQVRYRSAFGSIDGAGQSPAGARVTVQAATPITVTVVATLTIKAGYDAPSVRTAAGAAVNAYLATLAGTSNNDVQYISVGAALLNTPGVQDVPSYTVNGGTSNITITPEQVAVAGAHSIF